LVALQTLVEPDRLEETLGGLVARLAQHGQQTPALASLGVEAGW
jgi:hypothetical protein